jgi:hypothetical protein
MLGESMDGSVHFGVRRRNVKRETEKSGFVGCSCRRPHAMLTTNDTVLTDAKHEDFIARKYVPAWRLR